MNTYLARTQTLITRRYQVAGARHVNEPELRLDLKNIGVLTLTGPLDLHARVEATSGLHRIPHPWPPLTSRGEAPPTVFPGSEAARRWGCTCQPTDDSNYPPVLANMPGFPPFGARPMKEVAVWWVIDGCPLHDKKGKRP